MRVVCFVVGCCKREGCVLCVLWLLVVKEKARFLYFDDVCVWEGQERSSRYRIVSYRIVSYRIVSYRR